MIADIWYWFSTAVTLACCWYVVLMCYRVILWIVRGDR